jgi:FtsZ-binding cell division protein ZapB
MLAVSQSANGQSNGAPTAPKADNGKAGNGSDSLLKLLQFEIEQLKKDMADLKSTHRNAQKDIDDLKARMSANDIAVQAMQEAILANTEAIKRNTARLKAHDGAIQTAGDTLKQIATKDSQGAYVLNLLGNMQKSADFRDDFKAAIGQTGTAGRVFIRNNNPYDDYLYVNGVRWRFLPYTTHYVDVPWGAVYLQRDPNQPATRTFVLTIGPKGGGPEPKVDTSQITR